MDIRFLILSAACFSCLVPPAFGAPILVAKALAALGALKGAAVLGGGALAAIAAKGLLLKGLAAKSALIAGAQPPLVPVLPPTMPVLESAVPVVETAMPVLQPAEVIPIQQPPRVVLRAPSLSNIFSKLGGLISVSKNALLSKTAAVGDLLGSMLPTKAMVAQPPMLAYVSPPKFYPMPVPVIEKVVKK